MPLGRTVDSETAVPVSAERVKACFESAYFWTEELPRYADGQQRWADAWALIGGIVAAVTSLAVWPGTQGADDSSRWLVSAGALAAAICALFPRVMNYGELAGKGRTLASEYGTVLGDLEDLVYAPGFDQTAARRIVKRFETIKSRKDELRGLPDKEKTLLKRKPLLDALAKLEATAKQQSESQPAPAPATS